MKRSRTTYREYVRIQQLQDELEQALSNGRDLYQGANLSDLGHQYDLHYITDKRLGRLPQLAPVALTWLEGLFLAVFGFTMGFLVPMVPQIVSTLAR